MLLFSDTEHFRFGLVEKDLLGDVEVSMPVVSGDLMMNFKLRLRLVNFLMRELCREERLSWRDFLLGFALRFLVIGFEDLGEG